MCFVNVSVHFCNSTIVGWCWVNLLALAICGNVFSWMHSDETIPRRSLANSLATYLHPPVWSSPMCLMVWLPSQRSQPQDRVETTGSIWKSKPYIYIYIYTYTYIHYIYIYIVHTVIIEDIQELSENRSSIWNGFGRAEKAISNRR